MGRRGGRSAKEVEQIVVDFERSGLKRGEYSERRGIAPMTLDWYRRRVRASRSGPGLVPVKIAGTVVPMIGGPEAVCALVLGNGIRIETSWDFNDDAMRRLIRIAGAA